MRAIIALTSERVIDAACNFPQRGIAKRSTRAAACRQLLLCFLACCSTYLLASSANVPAPRWARFSATGSNPLATASIASAAMTLAVSSGMLLAGPSVNQRDRPLRE